MGDGTMMEGRKEAWLAFQVARLWCIYADNIYGRVVSTAKPCSFLCPSFSELERSLPMPISNLASTVEEGW